MTRRERLERKIALRTQWSEGRRAKATALLAIGKEYRHDWAFITQPGRIVERERMNARDQRAFAHLNMAKHHESRGAGLADQVDRSIYSDDPDAIEALEARLATLLAEQAERKKRNALYRKGGWSAVYPDATPERIASLEAETAKAVSWCRCPHPAYEMSNANGRIKAARDRIEQVKRRQAAQAEAEATPNGIGYTPPTTPDGWCAVMFAEKPDREIIDALKANGFRWGSGRWFGPDAKLPESVRSLIA